MYRYKRVFLIVMDSLGIGAMPDSDKFGDGFGVDTLGHIAEKMDYLLPYPISGGLAWQI